MKTAKKIMTVGLVTVMGLSLGMGAASAAPKVKPAPAPAPVVAPVTQPAGQLAWVDENGVIRWDNSLLYPVVKPTPTLPAGTTPVAPTV